MPVYVPKTKYRYVSRASYRNRTWETWRILGLIFGIPLIIFGVAINVVEVVRILYGPTYRGITNYNVNDLTLEEGGFPIGNAALLFPIRDRNFPQRVEKFHYWPWSYAANLGGLLIIAAGFAGVLSAYRRSYTSIFAFMTLCLLSTLISGYLIGYYSILTNYYIRRGLNKKNNRPDTMDTSWGTQNTNLAFCIAATLFSFLGFLVSFIAIRACRKKGFSAYKMNDVIDNAQIVVPQRRIGF